MSRVRRARKGEVATDVSQQGGTMEVTLKGPADDVREQMGIQQDGNGAEPRSRTDEFVEALRNPKFQVAVKRIAPREVNGQRANFEVFRESCPLELGQIEEEVFGNHGGKRYRVAVLDSESGATVAAKVIETDADPIIPESEPVIPEFFTEREEPGAMNEKFLEQQIKITGRQLELEGIKQQLESIRGGNGKSGKGIDDSKYADLQRQIMEAEHRREVAALRTQMEETARRAQQPAPPQNDKMLELMMRQMEKSDERFNKLIEQMQQNQLTAISQKLDAIQNKPRQEGSNLKDSIQTVKDIAEMLGVNLPGADDDDDDDGRPKEWYEVLGEKVFPAVMDYLKENKKEGNAISKEEIVARFAAEADRAAQEEVAKKMQLLQQQRQQMQALQQQPVPVLQQPIPPAPQNQPPPPVAMAPVMPPPSLGPTVSVPQAPAPAPVQPTLTPEQEMAMKVAAVLSTLDTEMTFRARAYEWNFEAWELLPGDLLEKISTAPDVAAFFAAFEDPRWHVNPEALVKMRQQVTGEPKIAQWMQIGMKELAGWFEKAKQDPTFSPGGDADGDGEEG